METKGKRGLVILVRNAGLALQTIDAAAPVRLQGPCSVHHGVRLPPTLPRLIVIWFQQGPLTGEIGWQSKAGKATGYSGSRSRPGCKVSMSWTESIA